jgi:hexokinase
VGFCFSYPTDILPNKDGKLIRFNKEVRVDGMEGEPICEGIAQALVQRGHRDKMQFVLLNDSVATMLGGMAANPGRGYDSYIGFILGTGMNTCYLEQNKNITKADLSGEKTSSMVINMESGGYNRMPAGEFDDLFDSATNNPGNQRLEKMLSGAYQGGLIHLTVCKAMEEGLFSEDFVTRYKELPTLTMRNIDDFCFYPYGENVLAQCAGNNEDDRLTFTLLSTQALNARPESPP